MFAAPVSMANQYRTQAAVDGLFVDELSHGLERRIFDANDQIFAWKASRVCDPGAPTRQPLRAAHRIQHRRMTGLTRPSWKYPSWKGVVAEQMRAGLERAVTLPISNATYGRSSYISARLWVDELRLLLSKMSSANITFGMQGRGLENMSGGFPSHLSGTCHIHLHGQPLPEAG
ncbi:hypothetical protein PG994_004596 [Apiospora phragmitis]|uniref:Uncharacterized protein n=1 Tax=Apiospora phragmitis TaxID=2905665 RepID=A0ABR1VR51_9PEZI